MDVAHGALAPLPWAATPAPVVEGHAKSAGGAWGAAAAAGGTATAGPDPGPGPGQQPPGVSHGPGTRGRAVEPLVPAAGASLGAAAAWQGRLPPGLVAGASAGAGAAAGPLPQAPTAAAPAAAPAAADDDKAAPTAAPPPGPSLELERLLAQARRSAFDPVTDKARCRACGKAFSSHMQLAQHLGAAHGGVNSEDAKFMQLRQQAGAGGGGAASTGPAAPLQGQPHQTGPGEFDDSAFPGLSAAAALQRPQLLPKPPAGPQHPVPGLAAAPKVPVGRWAAAAAAAPSDGRMAAAGARVQGAAPSASAAAAQPAAAVRPSKRLVTLSDLFDGMPGSSRSRPGAAGAAGRRAPIRVSNALRVVSLAPRPAASAGAGGPASAPGRGGGDGGRTGPAKKQRLTEAGTIAAPRKRQVTRAKRLVLQHRMSKALAERSAAYVRARQAYAAVLQAYSRLEAELQLAQHALAAPQPHRHLLGPNPGGAAAAERPRGAAAGAAAASATVAPPPPPPAAAAADGAQVESPQPAREGGPVAAASAQQPGGSDSDDEGPEAAPAAAQTVATVAVVAAVQRLPAHLRPRLLRLALEQVRPRLEALHKAHAAKQAVFAEGLRQHALAHKQPEPSEDDLQLQAPLERLPPPLAAAAGVAAAAGGGVTEAAGHQADVGDEEGAAGGAWLDATTMLSEDEDFAGASVQGTWPSEAGGRGPPRPAPPMQCSGSAAAWESSCAVTPKHKLLLQRSVQVHPACGSRAPSSIDAGASPGLRWSTHTHARRTQLERQLWHGPCWRPPSAVPRR